jgi:hypothetical protein
LRQTHKPRNAFSPIRRRKKTKQQNANLEYAVPTVYGMFSNKQTSHAYQKRETQNETGNEEKKKKDRTTKKKKKNQNRTTNED